MVYDEKPGDSIVGKGVSRRLDTGEVLKKPERLEGIPDITVMEGARLVIKAKFSFSPTYLTQTRYKTLAYLYKYNAKTAVLAHPGPVTRREFDEDEEDTRRILVEARRRDGLEVLLATGRKLYLLPLPPDKTEENIVKIEKVLARSTASPILEARGNRDQ